MKNRRGLTIESHYRSYPNSFQVTGTHHKNPQTNYNRRNRSKYGLTVQVLRATKLRTDMTGCWTAWRRPFNSRTLNNLTSSRRSKTNRYLLRERSTFAWCNISPYYRYYAASSSYRKNRNGNRFRRFRNRMGSFYGKTTRNPSKTIYPLLRTCGRYTNQYCRLKSRTNSFSPNSSSLRSSRYSHRSRPKPQTRS